jgi:hypothetical protein
MCCCSFYSYYRAVDLWGVSFDVEFYDLYIDILNA